MIKDKLLKKINEFWEKVKNSIKKGVDSEPFYNEKYIKAKIKTYNVKLNTNVSQKQNTKRKFGLYLFNSNFG